MIKTLTFATVHMSVAFVVVYVTTGSLALGGAVALIEPLCNTVAYFFHDRLWDENPYVSCAAPRIFFVNVCRD